MRVRLKLGFAVSEEVRTIAPGMDVDGLSHYGITACGCIFAVEQFSNYLDWEPCGAHRPPQARFLLDDPADPSSRLDRAGAAAGAV